MKQLNKPTRKRKEFMSQKKIVPANWLIVSDGQDKMVIINKTTNTVKTLIK